jgi:hypothetical protein
MARIPPIKRFDLFGAVRIISLPEGRSEIPAYYSQMGKKKIKLGDIGVVLAQWPGDKYCVEVVTSDGTIVWPDHFEPSHLEFLPATAASFSRRRINEHWAYQLGLGEQLLDSKTRLEFPLRLLRRDRFFRCRRAGQRSCLNRC